MTLDMLNVMLAVSEEGMIEEMLLALLASPQLAVFFEKFPRLKNIIAADIPRWREAVRARLKEVNIPPDLDAEVQTYQQAQLLSTSQFIVQLPQILGKLHQLQSPFAAQAQKLVDDNATFTPALHTLFLQRWRLSLVVQATSLNQQLLDEERDQLLSEVQERMTLSGQLDPVLAENDTAAGRLWDMSAGELKRGDYQLIVRYGDFLNQQPELLQLAEQLGRSREAKSVPKKDAPMEPSAAWYASRQRCLNRSTASNRVTTFYACCRRSWRRLASRSWSLNFIASWWRNSCSPTGYTAMPGARKLPNAR